MTDKRTRLRALVRGTYDLQKLRIAAGLRLCANFKAQIGQAPGEDEDGLSEEAKKLLKRLRASFVRLTDGIARNRRLPAREGFAGDDLISDYTDLVLVGQYLALEREEVAQFAQFEAVLEEFPIYVNFLRGTRGVGPAMAGVIISSFDISKARYPSSLAMYAGLDVAPDGFGRSKRKEHLVKRAYTTRAGAEEERDGVTYNPWLKTKLTGVLAPSFLRSGSEWRQAYDDYKHRLETDPARTRPTLGEWKKLYAKDPAAARLTWPPGRIHNAAKRYMIKMFLQALYNAWRPLEGLPVSPTYQEAKLGHVHGGARPAA